MTEPQRRLPTGKLPAQPARPHLRLAAGITTTLPVPPAAVDYDDVNIWGMLGNADWGCCVESYLGHAVEQITEYATGTEQTVTDGQTLAIYSAVAGFDPDAGPPGDNPTDQGTNMQDALTYWRKSGIYSGHKIAAFASVTLTSWDEIENAVNLFGHVSIGFNFPDSAMDQFNAGEPWTVVKGSPVDGGHCVMMVSYDADWLYVVTWGQVQKMARAFWSAYVDEAWVPITQETINAQGANAFGGVINLAALGAAFAALTGDPNPFPGPVPDPTPAPVPGPSPVPDPGPVPPPVVSIDAADQTLHDSRPFQHVLHHHSFAGHDLHRAALKWVKDKGFPA
jgi:hypothetical protein